MLELSADKPILIAGPTASGKSALALKIASETNGAIINADALQVYSGWSLLTARPDATDLSVCPHYLYGHVEMTQDYSVGTWLKDASAQLTKCIKNNQRPIFVGGTGLYFTALTQGLSHIPDVSPNIRNNANTLAEQFGLDVFAKHLKQDDPETYDLIDVKNPVRTQRAWEVLQATGQGLSHWHKQRPAPIVSEKDADLIVLTSDTDWLNDRINRRFDYMIENGALKECKNALENWWDERLPSCKAIGAKELIEHLKGGLMLGDAIKEAKTQSRRYAKRQRTWFRNRMKSWTKIHISDTDIHI